MNDRYRYLYRLFKALETHPTGDNCQSPNHRILAWDQIQLFQIPQYPHDILGELQIIHLYL